MLYEALLEQPIQKFIKDNLLIDIPSFLLHPERISKELASQVALQIQAARKAKEKLPSWWKTLKIYWPHPLSVEQASSEATAMYKSTLVSGSHLLDLTGGLGVDSWAFSQVMDHITYVEQDINLTRIARHNFRCLDRSNIEIVGSDAQFFLSSIQKRYDWVFLDPSRRARDGRRIYGFEDASPKLSAILPRLIKNTPNILIKSSPMVDLAQGIKELPNTKIIYIVSLQREVKEILWQLGSEIQKKPLLKVVDLDEDKPLQLSIFWGEEKKAIPNYGAAQAFIYEPHPAINKLGVFNWLSQNYGVSKLAKQTHLYTSSSVLDFPGRCFILKRLEPFTRSLMAKVYTGTSAHLIAKNFPIPSERLRIEFQIKPQGATYLFLYRDDSDRKWLMECEKI